jgi:hypothetical protein
MKNMDLITTPSVYEQTEFAKCDSCPARAWFRISLITGTLDFCRHHYLANQEKLALIAINTVETNIEETN